MILVACSHCGTRLDVPAARCPRCDRPLPAPEAEQTVAFASSGWADVSTDNPVLVTGDDSTDHNAPVSESTGRYLLRGEVARGGMGVVLLAVDREIRREVALKFLLDDRDALKRARLVEEARITGQLEHPNIVPVHELCADAGRGPYFSMKMVRGVSLECVLRTLEQNPREAEAIWPLSRLLNVFVGVCHALAYAHSRSVIHRDLKPANVMVGDFGEVYVMDWGLAKVLSAGAAPAAAVEPDPDAPTFLATDRGGDLTRDGAVLGTPLYMPPEQARGDVHALDARTDVYALGGLLYALLTLRPPIPSGGDFTAVLQRVVAGDIERPEARAPGRHVPPELSAIAMKALTTNPAGRYARVEDLRRDVERYQEGRSVSARRDGPWVAARKFVRRNPGLSAGLGAAALALVVGLVAATAAWRETRTAYTALGHEQGQTVAAYQSLKAEQDATAAANASLEQQQRETVASHAAFEREQREKDRRTREAVPAFLDASRQAIAEKRFDTALTQVAVALDYAPDNADALLLKGQLMVSRKAFPAAAVELDRYVRLRPTDVFAARLAAHCAAPDVPGAHEAMGQLLVLQRQPLLATDLFQTSDRRLALYREQMQAAWPGLEAQLKLDRDHRLTLYIGPGAVERFGDKLLDLSPLSGIPLAELRLNGFKTRDLSPLRGMPLMSLQLDNCPNVKDLSPLRGLPLTTLVIDRCPLVDDLSPLKGMPLTSLRVVQCPRVKDLTPLRGIALTKLALQGNNGSLGVMEIDDITPLRGMPVQDLILTVTKVKDIEPLRGMPLRTLNLHLNRSLKDLSPLEGAPLQELSVAFTAVSDLTPLRGMPLTHFECGSSLVTDVGPLEGMKLTHLVLGGLVRDLTPLRGMPLESVYIKPPWKSLKGLDALREMETLRRIVYGTTGAFEPAEFWRKLDAGELK